jgi:RNA polymerase sigma-70 factor, ECF subfamily
VPDARDPQTGRESGETAADVAGLLTAAARGDERAWRELIHRYGRRVYALAKSRCQRPELAEEVTQSVFATVAAKLGRGGYTEQGKFEPWLFRVAMNRIRDEVRRSGRQAEATDPAEFGRFEARAAGGAGANGTETGAALERLRGAMRQLPDADREIVELRHHGGMSFKDMADLLDEPMGTLLARHHRALRKLKALMGEDDE